MKIVGFLLYGGRKKFFLQALRSLKEQKGLSSIIIINDTYEAIVQKNKNIKILQTKNKNKGWTYAFEFALLQVPHWADYFFVMHDDDILEPNYVKKMQRAGLLFKDANVLSCSLKHIDESGKTLPLQPFQFSETQLSTSRDVAFHYLRRCIPFPSCFYKNRPDFRKVMHHQLGSFADGLFLAQYTDKGTAIILEETLYRYRSHPAQVSSHPPAQLEQKFFQHLEREIEKQKDRKKFRRKLLNRQYTCQYEFGRGKKNASVLINWFFARSISEKIFLLSSPKRSLQFLKTTFRYLLEKASSQNL